VVVALLVVLVGARFLIADGPTYEATARLVVGPLGGDSDTVRAAAQLARTSAEMAESEWLLDEVAEAIGLPRDEVSAEVEASSNEVTRLVVISVRDDDATQAAALANGLVDALTRRAAEETLRPEGGMTVLDRAAVPTKAVGQNAWRRTVLTLAITGTIAAGLVVLISRREQPSQ
jgi:capsular polysaccharide biosynthesis protein